MSQVVKSASALLRAFVAMLDLEAIVSRLLGTVKAGQSWQTSGMALSSTKISCASLAGAGNQSNLFLSSLYRCGQPPWSAEMIKPSRISMTHGFSAWRN
jgi:hypothetical protein